VPSYGQFCGAKPPGHTLVCLGPRSSLLTRQDAAGGAFRGSEKGVDGLQISVDTDHMRRITVDFEDDIHLRLKIRCAQENVPISELIRRLVDEYLTKAEKKPK
jgi:hypothetical protein